MSNNAKIIAIINQKGGVGKTTTVVNLAASFAKYHNKKSLIIDFDPQGNASTSVGLSQQDRTHSIYEAMMDDCTMDEAIFKTDIKKLFIIPAIVDLSACEVEIVNMENREFILKEKISQISSKFDYIFIDCPPSLGLLTINALAALDSVIIPMKCEFFSLEGLSHLLTTIDLIKKKINPNLHIAGILLTMHDKRNNLTEQVEKDVRDFLGNIVYKTTVPRNVRLSEAPSYGKPVITYDEECAGSKSYISLAKEIINKFKNEK